MDKIKMPVHIAFILDGNGRWAKNQGLKRKIGYIKGAKVVENIVDYAYDFGIKYITLYAFSTENWNRPKYEVSILMNIFRIYLNKLKKIIEIKKIAVRVIGDKSMLDPDIQRIICDLEKYSSINNGFNLQIAISYGGRDEIKRAVERILNKIKNKELCNVNISEQLISDNLDTMDIPDPDLLIRTSGEKRISNFLIWQLAYTEFYFTDVLWPDFTKEEFIKAIKYYSNIKRKFGKLEEQLEEVNVKN